MCVWVRFVKNINQTTVDWLPDRCSTGYAYSRVPYIDRALYVFHLMKRHFLLLLRCVFEGPATVFINRRLPPVEIQEVPSPGFPLHAQQATRLPHANNHANNGQDVNGQDLYGKNNLTGQDPNGQHLNGQDLNSQNLNGQNLHAQSLNGQRLNGQPLSGGGLNGQFFNGQNLNGGHHATQGDGRSGGGGGGYAEPGLPGGREWWDSEDSGEAVEDSETRVGDDGGDDQEEEEEDEGGGGAGGCVFDMQNLQVCTQSTVHEWYLTTLFCFLRYEYAVILFVKSL